MKEYRHLIVAANVPLPVELNGVVTVAPRPPRDRIPHHPTGQSDVPFPGIETSPPMDQIPARTARSERVNAC